MTEQSTNDIGTDRKPLPEFAEPPLDEVAIGVQFDPPTGFSAAHIGAYWSQIRGRYPIVEDGAPLAHQKEMPDFGPMPSEHVIRFSGMPSMATRCLFTSPEKGQLVQIQRDQFYLNWRRFEGNEKYPRYTFLREEFGREWEEFQEFCKNAGLSRPNVNQCELTYVNQVPKGSGWETFADCSRAFTVLSPFSKSSVLADPEIVSWSGRYKLPDGRGRLHVDLAPAFRGRDFKLVMGLSLKVRGAPASPKREDLFAWFDLAHEWAVSAFAQITTPEIQALWKKQ